MSGFDDLFKPFDDIIEDIKPIDDGVSDEPDESEEVWGEADSWNSGKIQDIWNNDNDNWDTKDDVKDDPYDLNEDDEDENEGFDLDID